ncbi:hypothetical protein T484DRAFT_1923538 [Baffinella frigidus]|nr:hypothetical protein T484DRAFT_1923538 [Cryptophyta sp. CCMP2293]
MLSLKKVAKLLTISADARRTAASDAPGAGDGGDGADHAKPSPSHWGTLRDFLDEDGKPPLVRLTQRWQRATRLEAVDGLEEWVRVRKWSTSSEELAAQTMHDLTSARNIVVGGRTMFLAPNPDADAKRIQLLRTPSSEEPRRRRRLPSADVPSGPYDAFKPKVSRKILRLPVGPPAAPRAPGCKPRRPSVSSHGTPRPSSAGSDASGHDRFGSSFSDIIPLRWGVGESRSQRFARADASRSVKMQREIQTRSCENSPVMRPMRDSVFGESRPAKSCENPVREFQPVKLSW